MTRFCTTARALRSASFALSALALSMAAHAQFSNPYERGPDPSTASLEAEQGPFIVGTLKVASQSDFGGGTVYYPTSSSQGSFGLIALAPGFVETESTNSWWGQRLASQGFVVIIFNAKTLFDFPGPRAKQMAAALKKVVALSQARGNVLFGKVDAARQGVMGHSMGGGATLEAARDNPSLKAALPMAPWDTNKDFGKVTVPTMVIACEKDIVAPVKGHADTFYASLNDTVDKAMLQFKGGDHMCPTNSAKAPAKALFGKYAVSWMKRFIDNDRRYSPFLCGAEHQADLGQPASLVSVYKDNCPY